jgi:hypothetical protein
MNNKTIKDKNKKKRPRHDIAPRIFPQSSE